LILIDRFKPTDRSCEHCKSLSLPRGPRANQVG
jgi:hypothetical protein